MSIPAMVYARKTTEELRPSVRQIGFFSVRWRVSPSLASQMAPKVRITPPGRAPQGGKLTIRGRKGQPYGEYPFSAVTLLPLLLARPHDEVNWGGNAYEFLAVGSAWILAEWLAARKRAVSMQPRVN